jgi:hypothetical protein
MSDYLYNTHPEFLAAHVREQKAKEQAPDPLDAADCSGFGRDYEVIITAKTQVKGYDSCDAAQNVKVADAVKLLRKAGWNVDYQTS